MASKVILSYEHLTRSDTTAEISSARASCLIQNESVTPLVHYSRSCPPRPRRAHPPPGSAVRGPVRWPGPRACQRHQQVPRYLAPAQVPGQAQVPGPRTGTCAPRPPCPHPAVPLWSATGLESLFILDCGCVNARRARGAGRKLRNRGLCPALAGAGSARGGRPGQRQRGNGSQGNAAGQRYPAQRRRERRSGERQPGNDGRARPAQRSGSGSGCVCSTVSRDTARVSAT